MKTIKSFLFILLMLNLFQHLSNAQTSKIDSLFNVYNKTKHDTTRCRLMIKIGYEYEKFNPDTAIYFYNKTLQLSNFNINNLSRQRPKNKGQEEVLEMFQLYSANALQHLGWVECVYKGNYDTSLYYSNKALKVFEELCEQKSMPAESVSRQSWQGIASCYNNISIVFVYQGNYERAIEYFQKSLKIYQNLVDKEGMSSCYNNFGLVYNYQGNYDKAIKYYLKSLKIYEELENKNGMSICYNNIGNVHRHLRNYDKAIEYYFKSLKIYKELVNKYGMSSCYNNIGLVYNVQGNYNKAIEYYLKSLKIFEELGDKDGMSACYNNIGLVHFGQGNYDKAIEYYLKSLKIDEEHGDKNGISIVYGDIADLHIKIADTLTSIRGVDKVVRTHLDSAILFGKKSLNLAREIKAMPLENNAANILMEAYRKLGNYKKAMEYADIFITTKDSMFNEEKTKSLAEAEKKFEAEKKQLLIDKQQAEISRQMAISSRQRLIIWFIVGGLVMVIVFAVFIVQRLRITRRQKRIIEKQKAIVDEKNRIIEQKNKDITDSIHYAKKIQEATLTSTEYCKQILPEHFILFKPKDIVSGDFYWAYQISHPIQFGESKDGVSVIWTVADCTGHGVPGAFMSMIGNSLLNEIVIENGITSANEILNELKKKIIKALGQSGATGERQDGMDASLCVWHKHTNKLEFAGAYNPLWIIRKNNTQEKDSSENVTRNLKNGYSLLELKADKQPIGFHPYKNDLFIKQEIQLQQGDTIYLFSDGYADQFGGDKGKKFSYKRFKDLLLSIQDRTMEEQKQILDETIENWRGEQEQIDDICVIGVRI